MTESMPNFWHCTVRHGDVKRLSDEEFHKLKACYKAYCPTPEDLELAAKGYETDHVRAQIIIEFNELARADESASLQQQENSDPPADDETDNKAKGSKRGRRAAYSVTVDKKLADDWNAAKANDTSKAVFTRGRGIKVRVLDATLARVRNKKNRLK